jgi:enoyl-CoA hydratase
MSGLATATPELHRLEAVVALLARPDAGELLSPVTGGPGLIALDLAGASAEEIQRCTAPIAEALPWLPCVTIAIGGDEAGRELPEAARLLNGCDVLLSGAEALPAFVSAFAETKIAALAFVQLLRAAPRRSLIDALFAESFVYSTLQSGAEFERWLERRRHRRRRSQDPEGPVVRMERDRDRLEIHFTRAAKHNAFSREMRDGLSEALQLALADPSIEEVILRGEGDSFCSGGDLDEFGSFPDPARAHAIRTTRSPAMLLTRLASRVRAEVHGACIGAGVELPAFTGRVVAEEDAFFQLPEVGMGLIPGAGGTASLPRRIGRQRTAWLGLSGARIDARRALAWGLVDEVRLGQHGGAGDETPER